MPSQRPSRVSSFTFPWKRNKAGLAPTIAIAPSSPLTPWELEDNSSFRGSPKRIELWVPSQNTGSSVDSSSSAVWKDLPSPPPTYEDANTRPHMCTPHNQKPLKHIGLCQRISDMAVIDRASKPTINLPLTPKQSALPFELSGRKSSFSPQVACEETTGKSVYSNLDHVDMAIKKKPPPINTNILPPARCSPPFQQFQSKQKASSRSVSTSPTDRSQCCPNDSWLSSPSSISSARSGSPSPVTLLQTDGQCWIFPNVTVDQVVEKISSANIQIHELADHEGSGQSSGTAPHNGSSNSSPTSANSSSPTGQGSKRRRNGGRGNRQAKITKRQPAQGDAVKKLRPTKYACPFSAHNPDRYTGVFNSCTTAPGLDWKYLIEHLTRVHNASARCIYCNKVWSTPNWEQELQTHYPTCPQKDKIMSKPECMSAAQEAVYKSTTNEHGHPDKRWVLLFLKLFPGKYPIPSPRYGYYVARHRIITPPRSTSSSPVEDAGDQPRSSTWFVFSQTTGEEDYSSPESSPSFDVNGIFSTQLDPPVAEQPTNSAQGHSVAQQVLGHSGPSWPQQPILDESEFSYGLSDSAFADSTSTLVMPETGDDGYMHLEKWMGQHAQYAVSGAAGLGAMF